MEERDLLFVCVDVYIYIYNQRAQTYIEREHDFDRGSNVKNASVN